jgi:tetratricopeptide (TPR) repeat protein
VKADEKAASARFSEGLKHARLGNYEKARVEFAQAHALKPGPATLRNLGEMEVLLGQWVAAARHFTEYFKTAKGDQSVLDYVRQSLDEARKHVGMVAVAVDVPNAIIKIDNELITQPTSRAEPWFVEPGPHVVRAKAEGYDEIVQPFSAQKGSFVDLSLAFRSTAEPPNSLPAEKPEPITPITGRTESRDPNQPGSHAELPNPRNERRHDEPQDDTRNVVVVSGAILASVGLGVGIVYGLKGAAASSDADRISQSIENKYGQLGCGALAGAPSSDCGALASARDQYDRSHGISVAGYVGFGVVGAATLGALMLWPASKVNGATSVSVSPSWVILRQAF